MTVRDEEIERNGCIKMDIEQKIDRFREREREREREEKEKRGANRWRRERERQRGRDLAVPDNAHALVAFRRR